MRYEFSIGTTHEAMQYLFELGVKRAPRSEFKPFSLAVRTGSLHTLGQGFATSIWDWGFIDVSSRNILRAFCTGLSAEVYGRFYNDSLASPAWEDYRTRMYWPVEAEQRENQSRLKFSLSFLLLEKIT